MTAPRLIIGCMSGTSMDGVDAALVQVSGDGLAIRCTLVGFASAGLDQASLLAECAAGKPLPIGAYADLRECVTQSHLEAISLLGGAADAALIVVHGQTVHHKPPLSIQMLNPWPIAAAWRVPVLFDLRGADLASGGQGAPITPVADWVLFRSNSVCRAVVNLGGFVNITTIPSGCDDPSAGVAGRDVCPCNHLLNALSLDRLGLSFDRDGETAISGEIDACVASRLHRLLSETGSRSLGSGDDQVRLTLDLVSALSTSDALASVCAAVAGCVADATPHAHEVILAGGGSRNRRLVNEISSRCDGRVMLSNGLGIPVQAREAMCMAVLGALALDDLPIHLPGVTGASGTLSAGSWIRP